ncbi:hypothetical protein BHE74_00050796 [Ensete ventricosum]|nr:hypothetical protein BHE74_00050796 [Ensete ventricosum]
MVVVAIEEDGLAAIGEGISDSDQGKKLRYVLLFGCVDEGSATENYGGDGEGSGKGGRTTRCQEHYFDTR